MHKWLIGAGAAAAVLLLIAFLAASPGGGGGPVFVASFPGLAGDVQLLACPGDRVEHVVPAGADPHVYQLTPSDLALVRSASLLVVSGHAPFEWRLVEKAVEAGVGVLAADELEGVRLARIPGGGVNYHFPVYDVDNYRVFIEALAEAMGAANPPCASQYRDAASAVLERVEEVERARGALEGFRAVASLPFTQYAVEWLGVEVVEVLVVDEGAQVSAVRLARIDEGLREGSLNLAVVAVDGNGELLTQADRWLYTAASKYGVPVLKVVAPYLPGSTIEKIEYVAGQALGLAGGHSS